MVNNFLVKNEGDIETRICTFFQIFSPVDSENWPRSELWLFHRSSGSNRGAFFQVSSIYSRMMRDSMMGFPL